MKIGVILILILFVLCFYYYTNHESSLEYTPTSVILSRYPYGSMVSVSGEVTDLNNGGFSLLDNSKRVTYMIASTSKVEKGDKVQLIGILGHSYRIKSTKLIVINEFNNKLVILRSVIALIVMIFIFLWYWKFNFKTFELVRRR